MGQPVSSARWVAATARLPDELAKCYAWRMTDKKKVAAGRKGGAARASKLTKTQLAKIGKLGGKALWARIRAGEMADEK